MNASKAWTSSLFAPRTRSAGLPAMSARGAGSEDGAEDRGEGLLLEVSRTSIGFKMAGLAIGFWVGTACLGRLDMQIPKAACSQPWFSI